MANTDSSTPNQSLTGSSSPELDMGDRMPQALFGVICQTILHLWHRQDFSSIFSQKSIDFKSSLNWKTTQGRKPGQQSLSN